jgi:hypothetical protein
MHTRMRKGVLVLACGGAVALASCGGDDHGGGQPPPTSGGPTSLGYEAYLQQEVKQSSCETNEPVSVANVSFVFGADQDTAEPRDLSAVTPGCQ